MSASPALSGSSVLVDTSVLIKWIHSEGEGEVGEARRLLTAHLAGDVDAYILDLALYEVGNVLIRALGWTAEDVAEQLDDLLVVVGPPLAMAPEWLSTAASLAYENGLSFYDASWAAVARELGVRLVSADRRLVASGLAETVSSAAGRLAQP